VNAHKKKIKRRRNEFKEKQENPEIKRTGGGYSFRTRGSLQENVFNLCSL
jgi:hypothetical protein